MPNLILTAGKGSRLKHYGELIPKPSFPVWGIPLFKVAIHPLLSIGQNDLIFNLHHLPQIMKAAVLKYATDFTASFSDESNAILGSGGAIKFAETKLNKNDFFYVNGDEVFFTRTNWAKLALQEHQNQKNLATIITTEHPELLKKFKAIWVDKNNLVKGFGQEPPAGDHKLKPMHFTGYQIFSNGIFNYLPYGESNIFYDVLIKAIIQGEKVQSFPVIGEWCEAGDPLSFIKTHSIVGEKIFSSHNTLDLSAFDLNKIRQSFLVQKAPTNEFQYLSKSVNIPDSTKLEGFVLIEDGATIKPNLTIKNSIVLKNSNITSDLTDSIEGLDLWKKELLS